MAVTAAMVKELREKTGAGMLDCKKALEAKDGNIEAAIDFLREKGLGKAAKKVDRLAAEGLTTLVADYSKNKATISEINSETDFVAKNENYVEFCKKVTQYIFDNDIKTVEELNESTIDGKKFTDYLNSQIAIIGENLVVRRMSTIEASDNAIVQGYQHFNGRVATIVEAKSSSTEDAEKARKFLNNVCMHITAMNPTYLDYTELTMEFVEKELLAMKADIEKYNEEAKRLGKNPKKMPEYGSMLQLTPEVLAKAEEAFKEELKAQNKPEKIWDKILPGQMKRFVSDNTQIDQQYCLNSQFYALNDEITVKQAFEEEAKNLGIDLEIVRFVRLEVGEGIEKKEENFAEEVAKQLNS